MKKLAVSSENEERLVMLSSLMKIALLKSSLEVRQVVTVAFFGENEGIYSNDSLPEFKKLTDHLIDFVFFGDEENKNYWNNEYEFSSDEIDCVENLYQLRCANPKEEIDIPKVVLLGYDFVSEESKASLMELKIRLV